LSVEAVVVEPTDYLPAGCVRMDVFSADEQAAIAALREQVLAWIDAGETAEPTADGTEAAQYLDDATLWRYAKARECDTEQALEMFKSSLCWKRETGIKQLLEEWRGESADQEGSFSGPHRAADLQLHPTTPRSILAEKVYYGGVLNGVRSVHGGPVMCERLGKLDVGGLSGDDEAMQLCVDSYCVYLEEAWRAARLCSTPENPKAQALVIVDLDGLSFSFLWHVSLIKRITSIGPPYYPEITRTVYICRAPSVFSAIWKAVSVFLPQRTLDKVKVLGSDYLDVLAEDVQGGLDVLPDYLGGSSACASVSPAMSVAEARATA